MEEDGGKMCDVGLQAEAFGVHHGGACSQLRCSTRDMDCCRRLLQYMLHMVQMDEELNDGKKR